MWSRNLKLKKFRHFFETKQNKRNKNHILWDFFEWKTFAIGFLGNFSIATFNFVR